jgi:hypothetical protein
MPGIYATRYPGYNLIYGMPVNQYLMGLTTGTTYTHQPSSLLKYSKSGPQLGAVLARIGPNAVMVSVNGGVLY